MINTERVAQVSNRARARETTATICIESQGKNLIATHLIICLRRIFALFSIGCHSVGTALNEMNPKGLIKDCCVALITSHCCITKTSKGDKSEEQKRGEREAHFSILWLWFDNLFFSILKPRGFIIFWGDAKTTNSRFFH